MTEEKYAATYQFGKTTVHVVSPSFKSKGEIEKVNRNIHAAAWKIIHY
ncbi:cell division protein FtsZ [Bacillus cereus]|uniref:Cell division protein FtsZ n=1 Tax=Bacillus cereus TaxID=1396 RepID=A0A2B3TTA4_BACCE|nr:cell division protein FtsZ [Bacillus cereus]PFU37825.1 cell division protein FtsZ [Bacillus cereus]